MPGIGHLLAAASIQAAKNHSELAAKWRDVYNGLSSVNADLARFQSDLWVDLILRSLEDELAARLAAGSAGPIQDAVVLADSLQHTLTRYWVLGTHDVLRTAKTGAGEDHPKLSALFEKFRFVRVPLAKLEITDDNKAPRDDLLFVRVENGATVERELYRKMSYYPPEPIDERGSIGWGLFTVETLEPVTIFRRDLSDELLALFD
jgi:hypothetical protein